MSNIFKVLLLLWLVLFTRTLLLAQVNDCSYRPPREAETWCFYSKIKLKFSNGSTSVNTLGANMNIGKGCASISDKNGDLQFFTDGQTLWSKNSSVLTTSLPGDFSSTQSSLFVPNPGNEKIYYIFTTHLLYPTIGTKGLNYTILHTDSILTSGNMPVKQLLKKTPEKLSGVRHSNGIDFWVVAHGWDNNTFYSWRVTRAGVDSIAVESNVGSLQSGTLNSRNPVGYMKLSPDGTKLAMAIMGTKSLEWFDFDPSTGRVSNVHQLTPPDGLGPYGIEFSPDSKKLYFTTSNPSSNSMSSLFQLDLTGSGTPVLLNKIAYDVTAIQLAVDGKIYVARLNSPYLGIIENPNRPGVACNFVEDGLFLEGNQSKYSLPNFIQSYLNIPGVTYDTKCQGDDTYCYITNPSNIDSLEWDFGDPASGASNISNQLQPSHIFSAPGNYTLTLTEYFQNQSFVSSYPVKINPLPPKSFSPLPDSMYILPGSAVILDAGNDMKTYQWSEGSATQTIEVSQPGYYNITIVDTNCCMQQDTMKILLLDLFVPNAFSPNADGNNDKFRVKGPTQGIDNYHFYIYNRWGQLLWETDNFSDGWDATFKGIDCPGGSYVWVMQFGVTGNVINKDKIIKRGMVTIVR